MKLDLERIKADLKEAAGEIKFKLHKHDGMRLSVRETDDLIDIKINPKHIRSQGQLDNLMNDCRQLFF